MKARFITDLNNKKVILCEDGTIAECTDELLYTFLVDFGKDVSFVSGSLGRWDTEYPDMSLYPGTEFASILDSRKLVITDFAPFTRFVSKDAMFDNYISSMEYAKLHNVSYEMVKVYCREGRIPGAKRIARNWIIPQNATYPIEPNRRR